MFGGNAVGRVMYGKGNGDTLNVLKVATETVTLGLSGHNHIFAS